MISGMFTQVLELCRKSGLVKLQHVALDGTKVKANASKHKAMSYGHMKKKVSELEADVRRYFAEAEATDAAEDELYGKGNRGNELPEAFRNPETRLSLMNLYKPVHNTPLGVVLPHSRKPCYSKFSRMCNKRISTANGRSSILTAVPALAIISSVRGSLPLPLGFGEHFPAQPSLSRVSPAN